MTTPWLFAACIGLLMAFVAFTTIARPTAAQLDAAGEICC